MSLCCCFFHEHIQEIKKVGKDLGIAPTIIRDEELKTRGFGGGSGLALAGLGLRECSGALGWQSGNGHVVCGPKLHPERNRPVSNPKTRPWEADCHWGERRQWFRF